MIRSVITSILLVDSDKGLLFALASLIYNKIVHACITAGCSVIAHINIDK